jgi:hypothetical protein
MGELAVHILYRQPLFASIVKLTLEQVWMVASLMLLSV